MKRETKKFVLLLFAVAILFTPAMFAQDTSPPSAPPASWADVIINPQKWLTDFGVFTMLIAFVATFVNGVLKIVKRWPRQLVAWGVAIAVLVVTDLFNIGYAANFPILLAVIHGFAAGLAANGAYNIPWLKGALDWIETLFNPKVQEQKATANK
jgi:hypothetical protein